MTPQEVLKLVKQKNVQFIDLRFMDFPGLWQHFSVPAHIGEASQVPSHGAPWRAF